MLREKTPIQFAQTGSADPLLRSMTCSELLHLAETLHPDSELRTDVGLFQSAESLIIARPLSMSLVTHLETAE